MLNVLSLLPAVGQRCTSCLNPPYEKWISGAIYSRLSCAGPKLVRDEMEAWIQKLREDVEAETIRARGI